MFGSVKRLIGLELTSRHVMLMCLLTSGLLCPAEDQSGKRAGVPSRAVVLTGHLPQTIHEHS
ncbi:MAG: hypothetical protein NVSMB6_03690 [Burkholderiaceae bacterium]